MEQKRIIWSRVYVFFFVLAAFALFLSFKIIDIQIFKRAEVIEHVKTTTAGYRPVPAERGDIYSSDGSLLATSLHYYRVGMDLDSKAIDNDTFQTYLPALCDSLALLIPEKSAGVYKEELVQARKSRKRWYKLSNELSHPDFKRLIRFPLFKKGRYKSGLVYKREVKRKKPFKVLASRTVGALPSGGKEYGLEGAYMNYLTGTPGKQYQRKVPGGVWVPVNDRNSVDPIDGHDVYSTIDIGMQEICNNALKEQLVKFQADYGCVVVMETKTGKVRAISNLKVDSLGKAYEPRNYAVADAIEPGSTFKLASMMALFEDGLISMDDKVNIGTGVMEFYDRKMRDSHVYSTKQKMSVREVFEKSSNVGVAKLVTESYGNRPEDFIARLFGFQLQRKLGISIHGESSPKIKDPSQKELWSGVTLPWMSIGYELELSPLQILAFYNAIANGGDLIQPSFVEAIGKAGKPTKSISKKVIKSAICSKETLAKMNDLLQGVVSRGTARKGFKSAPYSVAGKTGTAQINYGGKKKGDKMQYRASFVGYFPAEDPVYSCIVVVTDPDPSIGYYGGTVAVPVFRKISDRLYSTSPSLRRTLKKERVAESLNWKVGQHEDIMTVAQKIGLPAKEKNDGSMWSKGSLNQKYVISKGVNRGASLDLVPDVTSMGMKDAMYLLENAGLNVVVNGSGKVVSQSIPAGKKLVKGKTIELNLAS